MSNPPPRRFMVVVVVAWAVVLAVGIGWAVATGGPTAREQTTVADALAVVDRAVAEVVAASSDGGAVAAITGFESAGGCSISVLRPGERYQRAVSVVVTPGTEAALLRRVADRLPAEYGASVSSSTTSPRMSADAGFWVRLTGLMAGKGHVRFLADTGACRPLGDLAAAVGDDAGRAAAEANRAEGEAVLAKLGVTAAAWHTYRSGCANGGEISTAEAIGAKDEEPGALDEVLRGVGRTVVAAPEVYAYANGPRAVAVRFDGDHLVVTSTTVCPA